LLSFDLYRGFAIEKGGLTLRIYSRFVLIFGMCYGIAAHGQQSANPDAMTNPFAGDFHAVGEGRTLFNQTCSNCHGENAQGGRGPALTDAFVGGKDDAAIYHTIRAGIPGSQMPAFSALPTDDLWRLITYLHSLSATADFANEKVPGDSKAGEAIFWDKAGCGQCHEVDERGSNLGPDLSEAARESAAQLRAVILNPNGQQAAPGMGRNTPVAMTVKTRQGQVLTGMRQAEDNFTLLMMDLSGTLHSIERSDIVDEQVDRKSLMPEYSKTLSSTDVENLIAYLKTLKVRDLSATAKAVLPPGLTYERIRDAGKDPSDWLTYWGDYQGRHFSALTQITPQNVKQLQARWILPMPSGPVAEATPIVVDGKLYTTYTANGSQGVYAVDARSGLVIWKYERKQKKMNPYANNPYNRGVSVLGSRLFFGTLDGALVALDARSGREVWSVQIGDTMQGYSMTAPPLALKNEVIVGVAGGEFGIRGFIEAYDAQTGKQLWHFDTVPGPGQFGHETWSGDSWKHGSGATWMTGSFDPELNLLYWTVGNPGPDMDPDVRSGDNLFTCSVVALDADSGKLKWYYQFTPNDSHDWDSTEDVILADAQWQGEPRKLLLHADRNGMYYVLDRTNGRFLSARAYVKQSWNNGYTPDGKPILSAEWKTKAEGTTVAPGLSGGANWQNPSYDAARSRLFVVAASGGPFTYHDGLEEYQAGRLYLDGTYFTKNVGQPEESNLLAIDVGTGDVKWQYRVLSGSSSAGDLATATGVVFLAASDGNLIALDSDSGNPLWHFETGSRISSSPMSYAVDGRQYIAVSAGNSLFSFALPN
jgi:alcohol dehydrogenase (cytochrome c)